MPGTRLELKPFRALSITVPLLCALVLAAPVALLGPIALAVGIVAVAASAWLGVLLSRRRLVLDDDGVTRRGAFGTRAIRWDEAEHYTFWSMDQTYVAAGAAAGGGGALAVAVVYVLARALRRGRKKNRRFSHGCLTIHGANGAKLAINAQAFRGASDAVDRALEELHARLRTREPRDFSPFTLGEVDLHHATQGSLALADIDKVVVGGTRLAVKRRGKRRAWARARLGKVCNVMLLLEELAERGLVVDTKRDVFVPPPVLGKLEAAAARQAAMPQAKLVRR